MRRPSPVWSGPRCAILQLYLIAVCACISYVMCYTALFMRLSYHMVSGAPAGIGVIRSYDHRRISAQFLSSRPRASNVLIVFISWKASIQYMQVCSYARRLPPHFGPGHMLTTLMPQDWAVVGEPNVAAAHMLRAHCRHNAFEPIKWQRTCAPHMAALASLAASTFAGYHILLPSTELDACRLR